MVNWLKSRFFVAGLAGAGFFLFLGCQAPFLQSTAKLGLNLQLDSVVPGLIDLSGNGSDTVSGSRLLTADSKTVHLTIALPDSQDSAYYDQDVTVGVNASGKPSVSVTASGIPLDRPLQVSAEVKDASGTVMLSASRTITFKSDGSNGSERLLLAPSPEYPSLFTLSDSNNSLTLAAGDSRIIAMSIADDAQVSQNIRLTWKTATDPLSIRIFGGDGAELSTTAVLQGKAGVIFAPSAKGTVYGTLSNSGSSDIKLEAMALAGNVASVGISLGESLSHALVFDAISKSVQTGDVLLIKSPALQDLTGWKWTLDGVLDSSQSGPNFSLATSGMALGSYVIGASVSKDGIDYSGSMTLTIVDPTVASSYSVTYRNTGADSGAAPTDAGSYVDGDSATVLGAGTLSRDGYIFGGWSVNSDGSGTVYGSASGQTASLSVSGDTVLYPRWLVDLPMVLVPGGSFQRDAAGANTTAVSSFYMGKYEITQDKYQRVMGGNPSTLSGTNHENHPVETVSYYDAIVFCNKLSLADGLIPVYSIGGSTDTSAWGEIPASAPSASWDGVAANQNANGYRLPTEMENFWAALGAVNGSTTGHDKAYAGSAESGGASVDIGKYAWLQANSSGTTHPVGTKLPNELGIYDLTGNVYEWCDDWMIVAWPGGSLSNYFVASKPRSPYSYGRVFRGYSFSESATTLGNRISYTGTLRAPDLRNAAVGFRVVRKAAGTVYLPRIGLVGEWMLDGTTTATAPDSSGYGVTASSTAGVSSISGHRSVANSAFYLPGFPAAGYITTANRPDYAIASNQAITLSLWFMTSSSTGTFCLASQPSLSGYLDYSLIVTNTTLKAQMDKSGTMGPVLTAPITASVWHHAAMVYDASSMFLYLDGARIGSSAWTIAAAAGDTTYQFLMGHTSNSAAFSLDNVRIYNRALSAAEIQLLNQE